MIKKHTLQFAFLLLSVISLKADLNETNVSGSATEVLYEESVVHPSDDFYKQRLFYQAKRVCRVCDDYRHGQATLDDVSSALKLMQATLEERQPQDTYKRILGYLKDAGGKSVWFGGVLATWLMLYMVMD